MRSKPRLIPLLMLALALASVPAPASVAPAGTTRAISVDKVADHLPALGCTLREAIRVANEGWTGIHLGCTVIQSGSGIPITYHINLPKGGYTYVLTGAAAEDSNSSGDLDITANVTINGPAAGSTIIDGGGIDRVFHICPGGGCGNTVTFHSIAIRNGNVDGHGGGICSYSGTTTMDSSTVSANSATSHGGGIYNQATLIVQNGSAIGGTGAGNSSSNSGGGIYNYYGTVTVEDSTVSANVASVLGGGIFNWGGTLTVQNGSTIGGASAGNAAGLAGGGIYNWVTTVTVDGSTVSANTAGEDGGGIFNDAGTLVVQNDSTVGGTGAGNTAGLDGGGIHNLDGSATVDASAVSANTAGEDGGGILNDAGTLIVQNGSTIGGAGAGNSAGEYGGGIYNDAGTTTVDDSLVSANVASSLGGGIYNAGTLHVQNGSTIGGAGVGNTASEGGGIYNRSTGAVTVDGSTVSANSTDYDGGGIHNAGTLTVQHGSTIGGAGAGNRAASGGGIYNPMGAVTVDSSTVSANSATSQGGGIYNLGTLTVQNGSTIGGAGAGNTAGYQGGGIYTQGTTMMTGSRILHNGATTNGGGVYSTYNTAGATSVTGSCVVGNSAISFLNNWSSQQIATGNWWGAATGPNTPGADTVLGNVDVSGHLTAPILGCAPDLQVSKADDTAGNGTVGTPFHWTLTVSNTGSISATFTAGETILRDDLPTGPTYGSPVLGSVVDVDNSADIQCGRAASSLTCTAVGGGVTLGALSGSFQVTLSVTPGDPVTLVNPAGVCQVDPNGDISEGDETNNNCVPNVVHVVESSSYVYLPLVLK